MSNEDVIITAPHVVVVVVVLGRTRFGPLFTHQSISMGGVSVFTGPGHDWNSIEFYGFAAERSSRCAFCKTRTGAAPPLAVESVEFRVNPPVDLGLRHLLLAIH